MSMEAFDLGVATKVERYQISAYPGRGGAPVTSSIGKGRALPCQQGSRPHYQSNVTLVAA